MVSARNKIKERSARVSKAWNSKRLDALDGKPMTARCPAWLRLSADRKSYKRIPERVKIVRNIFAETIAGIGMYSVADRLTKASIPTFSESKLWHRSYIEKVLGNRAVFGEFQPHAKLNGKRVPVGDSIKGYFPPVISEETFHRAQVCKSERKKVGAGRKGASFTNLFPNLAKCSYCHSPIAFVNKGRATREGSYIICSNAKRGLGCPATRWPYKDFEASIFAFMGASGFDITIGRDDVLVKVPLSATEVPVGHAKSPPADALRMQRSLAVLTTEAAADFLTERLFKLDGNKISEHEIEELRNLNPKMSEGKKTVFDFVAQLQGLPEEKIFMLRVRAAALVRELVETLIVAPLGDRPKIQSILNGLKAQRKSEALVSILKSRLAWRWDRRRYFVVGFQNQPVAGVYPQDGDPLKVKYRVIAN